jgi:hypothetical protein
MTTNEELKKLAEAAVGRRVMVPAIKLRALLQDLATAERERDEALAATAVLGEALTHVRDGLGCQPGYVSTLTLRKVESALTSLPDAARALLENQRTPGTNEFCELCDIRMKDYDAHGCTSYEGFERGMPCPIKRTVKEP